MHNLQGAERARDTNALLEYSSGLKRQVRVHHKQRSLFLHARTGTTKKKPARRAERARDEPVNPAAFQIKNENKACCMNAHARTKLHSPITIESKACCVHMHAACSCMQMAHVLHAEANLQGEYVRGIRTPC